MVSSSSVNPLRLEVGDERLSPARRESHAEDLGGGLVEAAVLDELATDLGVGRRLQRRGIERAGLAVRLEQAVALLRVAAGTGVAVLVAERDAVLGGQPFDGLDEGQALDLHEELVDVAGRVAAEAAIEALHRSYVERRRLLVVERAQADAVAAGIAERDVLLDDLVDAGAFADKLDVLVLDPPWHEVNVSRPVAPHSHTAVS